MTIEFTAHNIRLDDGTFTKPDLGFPITNHPWLISAQRMLEVAFPGDKSHLRVVDLGCLEGGFAVEFARMGFEVLGIEVRESNIAACEYVKARTDLPNLSFAQDDVWNVADHGTFDAAFCCGLLYHLDRPKQFLETLSAVTRRLLILQTHFSTGDAGTSGSTQIPRTAGLGARLPRWLGGGSWPLAKTNDAGVHAGRFNLSPLVEHEGIRGRWFAEFLSDEAFAEREVNKWSSWENRQSFWVQREYLLQTIQNVGFDMVMEQYDSLGAEMAETMLSGAYLAESRGTFVGLKSQKASVAR